MSHSLIMPKQTGRQDVFYACLEIYYESNQRKEDNYPNSKFKKEIRKKIPSLGTDGPYLVKQSELTRYFGLVEYDYKNNCAKITNRGIRFYNAYLNNDYDTQIDILMNSIFNDNFGRNNTAIKSSDSDIDPPKLFIRSMYDLKSISRNDLAYLIYAIHDRKITYTDAICQFKASKSDKEIIIPKNVTNKYHDVKFTVLLSELGICKSEKDKLSLTDNILEKYKKQIETLSIYNKEPDFAYSLSNDLVDTDDEYESIEILTKPTKVVYLPYDINGKLFKIQNNRMPVFVTKNGIKKYKTNPRLGKTALHIANYKCEYDNKKHTTFQSKFGTNYMEAHHLVPMQAQSAFSNVNLDRIENIVCLCPTCHRAIHLGSDAVRLDILTKLFNKREKALKKIGINISIGELYNKYYK